MRKREREKISERLEAGAKSKQGKSLFVRPYDSDLKTIADLSQDTGESKSAIARKLIQRALSENELKLKQDRFENKLDWLIKTERDNQTDLRNLFQQIEALIDKSEGIEGEVKITSKNSAITLILLPELYCMLNIAISSLNQIFTKLLEYLSPDQTEREHSVNIGNAAMANLIAHSVLDLQKCSSFHDLKFNSDSHADLYVGTKIEILKDRLKETSSKQ